MPTWRRCSTMLVSIALAACAAPPAPVAAVTAAAPLVIAHRGASGYRPEHTLAAYQLAIEQGADFIEPDLVITKDGVLVARHENAMAILAADGSVREATTDVAQRPEFASRKTTRRIDGRAVTGWFTEDFTLAELKTLRARERLPALRAANTRFDGMFEVPTLEEVLQLLDGVNAARRQRGLHPVGLYAETKHPSYFQSIGLPLEEPLVQALQRHPRTPVFIQSFETANLRKLHGMTRVPLVQLLNASGRPYDLVAAGDPRSYADLAKPAGLAEIATYAKGIGASTALMIPLAGGRLGTPTTLVEDAHRAGLLVHGWTFRAENSFLPDEFDVGSDAAGLGDMAGQLRAFLRLGMDGFFTDQPLLGRQAVDAGR
jgi:glycerophosphoryl diester phosphodiesterase